MQVITLYTFNIVGRGSRASDYSFGFLSSALLYVVIHKSHSLPRAGDYTFLVFILIFQMRHKPPVETLVETVIHYDARRGSDYGNNHLRKVGDYKSEKVIRYTT